MITPHKTKYHQLYWAMAYSVSLQSVATRLKVGAVVVTPTGMISLGWNGMPSGFPNECEYSTRKTGLRTKPEVIHAERNALDKMTRQGVPTQDCVVFITHAPCLECAKSLVGLGLKAIYYDQLYKNNDGIELLYAAGITVQSRRSLDQEPSGFSAVQ